MASIVGGIVAIILILLLVIGLHEFGHFLAARCLGVKVNRVVLGLGRPFYTYTSSSGLEYGVTALPLGGYVKLLNEREAPVSEQDKPFSFTYQAPWRRIVILLAGSFVNILVAFFLYSSLLFSGLTEVSPIVGSVVSDSIVAKAGLKEGDRIASVDGWQTPNWSLALLAIISHSGHDGPMKMLIKRQDGAEQNLLLPMNNWHFTGIGETPLDSLGFQLPKELIKKTIQLDLSDALYQGGYLTYQYIALNFQMMKNILTGKISITALSGPLTLVKVASSEFDIGLERFLKFIALLSIAVGMVNLLPLPSLDGGHILYVCLEKIRGKSLPVEVEVLVYRFMLAAIFIFCMQLLANDVARYGRYLEQQTIQVLHQQGSN